MEGYQYTTLPSDTSFRDLELSPGFEDDLIDIRLTSTDWKCVPNYEAISYAWGDAADIVECKCDGKALSITRSLHEALVTFRRSDGSRNLWADAIWYNWSVI
jgi:hypothetical protein